MLQKRVRQIEMKCNVSENVLTELSKLAPPSFFVSIDEVRKDSTLNHAIIDSGQQFVTSAATHENHEIVLNTDTHFFNKIVPLLLKSDAEAIEVITIYFPFCETSFAQFLYNRNVGSHGATVREGLCCLTCTWVTENNSLLFCIDNFTGKQLLEKIKENIKYLEKSAGNNER